MFLTCRTARGLVTASILVSVSCGLVTGCNGHRIIGDGWGDGADEPEPDIDLPVPPLPPGCENGTLEVGDVCLIPESPMPAGFDPCDISVGDFDRDGSPDAAVPNSDFLREDAPDHYANVLFGDGEAVGDPRAYAAGGPLPVSIVTLDFDGDGLDDLAVGNSAKGGVTVMRNANADGSGASSEFEARAIPLGADAVGTIAAGDLDGDGRDEVLVPFSSPLPTLAVVRDDFVDPRPVTDDVVELDVGDVDADGRNDVVVITGDGMVQVLALEDVAGSWSVRSEVSGELANVGELRLVDLDHDGRLDVIATGLDLVTFRGVVKIFRGDGQGGFSTWTTLETDAAEIRGLAVEDFDHDGTFDLAVSDISYDRVHVYRGSSPTSFELVTTYEVGATPIAISTADFNGDGLPDIAVALQHANAVQVFASSP